MSMNRCMEVSAAAISPSASQTEPTQIENHSQSHFYRPLERRFLLNERDRVTVLFGGFTWKHERFIEAILRADGFRCKMLPSPDLEAFSFGRIFCNNGQCNPAYFTIGNLIKYLRSLEAQGMTRHEINEKHIFFTAGSCGPCRFGMYESEYRMALQQAGYDGFRIVLYQTDIAKTANENPGLRFTLDFNLGALNMLNLGDVIHDLSYRIRPFEVTPGSTDQAVEKAVDHLSRFLEKRKRFELKEKLPAILYSLISKNSALYKACNAAGKLITHLYAREFENAMREAALYFSHVEVDHTRIKPVVRIIGEFWAQLTEGDGNYNMFAFLEREGAQVHVDSIGSWISYLIYQSRRSLESRRGLEGPWPDARWWQSQKKLANAWKYHRSHTLLLLSEWLYSWFHARTVRYFGNLTPHMLSQKKLAQLAHPFYHSLARGGEGHLEVGKNIYYTSNKLCHMVLALKPFGCMPSSQSDGVQTAVVSHYPEIIFLPIETAGEDEINAYSRVQMALGEARIKTRREFDQALAQTGKSLEEIHAYTAQHRELRTPFYPFPRRNGIAGHAANFVLHVGDLIDGRATLATLPGEHLV